MDRSKLAGVLWLVAGVFTVIITVVFRVDVWQWIVTIALGIAAATVGLLLLIRPSGAIITWSSALGVVWLLVYAALTIVQRHEPVAWNTDVFIGIVGVVAAVVAYRNAGHAGIAKPS